MPDNTGAAAAALAATTPPDPNASAATPPPAPGSTPPPAPASNDKWYSSAPPEYQGLAEKKGWKDMGEALKSYAELEKAFHGDKIPMPKDDADIEGWGKLYDRLGRPKTPDEYKFPQGVDEATVKTLAPELHKLGITQRQAEALATIDIQRSQSAIEAETQRIKADSDAALAKFRDEAGGKYEESLEVMRRAMRGYGISVDEFTRLGAAIGHEKVMKVLQGAGNNLREDIASSLGDAQLGFEDTPNKARYELEQNKSELWEKARAGDKAAQARLDRLYQKAYPGMT